MLTAYEILYYNSHSEPVLNRLLAKSQSLDIICPKQNIYHLSLYVKLFLENYSRYSKKGLQKNQKFVKIKQVKSKFNSSTGGNSPAKVMDTRDRKASEDILLFFGNF